MYVHAIILTGCILCFYFTQNVTSQYTYECECKITCDDAEITTTVKCGEYTWCCNKTEIQEDNSDPTYIRYIDKNRESLKNDKTENSNDKQSETSISESHTKMEGETEIPVNNSRRRNNHLQETTSDEIINDDTTLKQSRSLSSGVFIIRNLKYNGQNKVDDSNTRNPHVTYEAESLEKNNLFKTKDNLQWNLENAVYPSLSTKRMEKPSGNSNVNNNLDVQVGYKSFSQLGNILYDRPLDKLVYNYFIDGHTTGNLVHIQPKDSHTVIFQSPSEQNYISQIYYIDQYTPYSVTYNPDLLFYTEYMYNPTGASVDIQKYEFELKRRFYLRKLDQLQTDLQTKHFVKSLFKAENVYNQPSRKMKNDEYEILLFQRNKMIQNSRYKILSD